MLDTFCGYIANQSGIHISYMQLATCNTLHLFTVHCKSSHSREVEKWYSHELISSITLYFNILLSSNFSALLCQLLFFLFSSKSVGLFDWPTCFRKFLTSWNKTTIYQDWLCIYICEIYRQYIGTGSTHIFVKYINNISGLAALTQHSLGSAKIISWAGRLSAHLLIPTSALGSATICL